MAKLSEQDKILRNKIAERLRYLRENSGSKQIEFATNNHIDRQLLSAWESTNNDRGMTIYTINKFCEMLGITLKEFFDSEIFDL